MKKRRLTITILSTGILFTVGFLFLSVIPASLAQTVKPVELKLGHFVPTSHAMHSELIDPWTKEIEKATEGRVKITVYSSSTLAKPGDLYDSAVTGIADFAYTLPGYTPGRMPLTEGPELPFIFSSARQVTEVTYGLWEKFPELRKEFAEVKVFWLWAGDIGQLFTKKPVRTMADIKGLKIRVHGSTTKDLSLALGASPITSPIGEVYEMLKRGVIDGVFTPWSAGLQFRFYEVTSYATIVNAYAPAMIMVMNPATFNRLSQKDREILEATAGKKLALKGATIYDGLVTKSMDMFKKTGIPIYELPPAEMEKWKHAAEPMYKEWTDKMDKKGLPGKRYFDEMLKLSREHASK